MILCPSCTQPLKSPDEPCRHCGFSIPIIDGFRAWAPEFSHAGGGFKEESFSHLAALEASNFWFRARNELIIWALRRYSPDMSSFLEVGCGTGYVLSGVAAAFPDARLVGSEIFVAGLSHAAKRIPQAELVQMDARRIPYVDEFDVVAALDVIEHIAEDEQVLDQLYKATKPNGGAIISVPQHMWLWSRADEYACHERRYAPGELDRKIRAAGFGIVRSTSFVSLLLPLMLGSRLAARNTAEFNPRAEFEIPPAINASLEYILAVERALVRAGLNLPAGGSRFIVARKAS